MTLPDGTIQQTIHKQSGHGPYLWAVTWQNKHWQNAGIKDALEVSVFSFWDDAAKFRDTLQSNGHTAQIDLATDNTRKIEDSRQ